MFSTVGQVARALKAFREYYHPKSSSVVIFNGKKTTDVDADPFRGGFLDNVDLRAEMLGRLSSLNERERAILMLWYVADTPVREICERLGLSRSHAYRLRDRALVEMLDREPVREVATAFA